MLEGRGLELCILVLFDGNDECVRLVGLSTAMSNARCPNRRPYQLWAKKPDE